MRSGLFLFGWACLAAPMSGQVPEPAALGALEFMAGCWKGTAGAETIIEEMYTRPSHNIMLGTTRYIRDGTTSMFEFALISGNSTGVTLLPYPRGLPSADAFSLTHSDGRRAVFEAPQHDFPKRIIYTAISADRLLARIDGGEGSERITEWELSRAACPGH